MRTKKVMKCSFATVAAVLLTCPTQAAPEDENPETSTRRSVEQWKGMFNKGIDFADPGLHQCMAYVYPQPEAAFLDLDDKKYAAYILDDGAYWMGQFFRKPCRPDVRKDQPKKYYLPKARGETGLVLHEWSTPKYTFAAQESGNGVLVRMVPKGYDPKKPVGDKELAALLFEVFDLGYASADELAAGFKLPKAAPAGTVFTNARKLRDVIALGDWRRHVVGFVGDNAVYVICYKSNPRMKFEFEFDRAWLNRCLLEKDGKTLVSPPPKAGDEKP